MLAAYKICGCMCASSGSSLGWSVCIRSWVLIEGVSVCKVEMGVCSCRRGYDCVLIRVRVDVYV